MNPDHIYETVILCSGRDITKSYPIPSGHAAMFIKRSFIGAQAVDIYIIKEKDHEKELSPVA